jgi:hypothetical protein
MRAGEPGVLHWLDPEILADGIRRARCGETSPVWRCVDDDNVTTASECLRCAEVGSRSVEGPIDPR